MTQYNKRYNIVLPDGRTEEWTQDQLTQAGGALMTKYPGAEVSEIMEQEEQVPKQQENNIFKPMDVGEMSKQMTSGNALQNFADQSVYVARNPESEYAAEDARRQQEYKESKLERYKEYKRDAETPEEKSFVKGEIKTLKQDIEAGKSDPRVIKGKETYYDAVAESQADIIAHTNVSLGDEWTGSYGERLSALWEAKALTQLTPQQTAGIEDKVFTDEQRAKENYVYARELAQQAQDLTMSPIDVDQKGQVKQAFGYAAKKYVSDPTNAVPAINSQMMFRIREIMEKLQAEHVRLGEPEYDDKDLRDILTDDEATLFEAYVAKTQAEAIRQNDKLRGYQGANIALESMPFMVEMLVGNKLIGGTEKVAKYALSKALKGQMNKLVAKGAGKFVQKLVRYGEGYAMDLGLRATKVGLMTTFAPSTKDRIGEKMVEVENGQLARTRAGAITSGYLSNYKEFFTETAGEIYGKAWDAALDLTGIDNIISKYVTSNIPDLVKKGWKAFNNSVLVDAGFNGAGEILEEVEGAFLDRVAGDKEAWREFWKGDNLLEMVIGFAPMTGIGLVQSAGQVAAQAYVDNQITDAERSFKRAYSGLGWTDTQWKNWFNYAREHADADVTARSVADMLRDFENRYVDQVLGDDSRMTDDEKLSHLEAAQKLGSALLMEYTARSAESALEESEKENIKNDILKKLNPTERTNIKFWHDDADKTVSLGTASYNGKPAQVYIVSEDASGVHAIAPDGKSINVPAGKVKRRVDMSLDQYLTAIARSSRAELEELSKGKSERALRKGVQKDLESGKVMEFDLGGEKRAATYGGMQNGMVIAHFEDVVELNGKTGTDIPVSVEEAARALGMNVFSYDEMRKNGIDHLAKGMALRNDLNDRFHGRGFISDGQQYRFRRIYKTPYKEAGEDMVDVVAYDQDGMMRNVSMKVSDLESQTPVSVEQSSYSLKDGVTATGEQLPMKHLEDGSMVVDEQALLEQDLQAWSRYHDEITGDGGADTWSYLTDVLSSDVAGRIAELREGLKAERLFSKREQIREEIARNEDTLRKIVEVKKGYVARKVAGLNNTGVQVIVSDSESVMNDMVNCSESERGSMSYALETGMQVRGVYSRSSGQVFLFADMIETIDQAGITFIHEQEHSVTHRNGNNRKLVHSLLGEAFDGLDIEKLEQSAGKEKTEGIEAVIALRSTFADIIHKLAGTGFYDNVGIYTLADEAISHMVEAAYAKGMTVTQAMMGYGIPEDIANLVETITSENRYERREEYYPASESAGDAYGSQRSGVDSAEDAAGAGEGQQLERPDAGSVPGSEGEETLGFSVAGDEDLIGNEEPDKNGFDSLQRAEIGKALGGELEIGDGSSALVFSVTAQVTGVGFDYVIEDNGAVSFVHPDGRKFDAQHHITTDDLKSVERSAFKYLENYCHKHGYYSDEDSERMWQKYADMLNAYLDKGAGEGGYGKLSSEWQWIADSVKRVFRAVATNSDKQYSKSLDITRVCKKNEAVINAISVLQRRMGHGITPGQVMDIYYNTIKEGYQAPCPVCYVFTRYIRNGQYATIMLNGKRKYGDKLQDVSKMSVKERTAAVEYWLSEYDKQVAENKANENAIKAAKDDITTILDKIDQLSKEYGLPKTSNERKAEIRKEIDRLDASYKSSLNVVSQASLHSWITQFAIHKVSKDNANKPGVIARKAANGKMQYWDLWEDQKPFPDEIALDLRETATAMTEFAAVQRFRNSRGAAAGKEITFAADNGVGEVALMLANEKDPRNYLQEAVDTKNEKTRRSLLKKAYDKLAKAHIYAQQQTLRGGQRMWSWSDNIERLAPDVFINILQLEMLGGGMQTYSKQLEGIKSVATMDAYVNGSLMGHGIGYMEVPEDMIGVQDGKYVLNKPITYTNERKNEEVVAAQAGDALYQKDGKFYALVFDDVVGVQAFAKPDNDDNGKVKKGLLDLNAELDKAGNIIVGMDDLHVIMSMADDRIFFIIPWHASGANNHLLAQMYRYLGSNKVKGRDFTNVQEEKYLGKTKKEETDDLTDEPEIGEETTEETAEETNGAGKVTPAMVEFWENHKNETDFPCGLGNIESGDSNGNLSEKQIEYKALRDTILKGYPVPTGKKDKNGKEKTTLVPIRDAAASRIAEAVEMFDKIRADIFLSQVEQTVYESVDTHLMTSGDTGFIYPYEYWDKKSTFSTADINGKRYLEYCRRMGYKPKFCGTLNPNAKEDYGNFADYKGYWKLLIDRRMYDRLGNYQDLVRVNTSKFTPDLIDPTKTKKEFIVTKVADAEGNESIAQKTYEQEMNRPGGLSTVNYDLDLKEAVRLYELAKENPEAYYAEIGQKPASEGLNYSVAPASDNAEELRESNLAFSIVTDQAEIDRLNNEPYVELYHAMQKITMPDGKTYLFPPMAAIQGDGYVQGIPVNEDGAIDAIWEKADERQDLAFRYTKGKNGVRVPEDAELTDGTISIGSGENKKEVPWKFYEGQPLAGEYNKETGEMEPSWYFSLKKGNKGDKGKKLQDLDKVAFDPYQHSAFNPVNDQFTTAYDRSHLVIVKVRVPVSEANGESGYKAEKAKLGVGTHEWTGGKLKTKNRRQVVLSRWDMPVEILSDEEVAKEWKKVLDENSLEEVPFNIVTPGQREALIDLGVKIGKPTNDNAGKAAIGEYEAWKSTTQEGLNFSVANNNQEVFISNALASLDKIPMKSGNAQAWINKIQQAGGLKKEEDKWIGLTDWLKEQKGDISKDDVAEYIREHQVRIKEVNYGMNLPEDAFEFDYVDDIDYAEVLINDWEKAVALYNKSNEDQIDVNDQTDENWEKVEEFGRSLLDNTINPQRENYTTDGLENKREIALVVPTIAPYKENDDIHFGDAGEGRAIGWARFGDAMDEDGNRVLIIDEVQSNRHQDGKEKGYSEKGFPSKMDAYSAKEKAFEDFDRVFSELSGKYSEEEIYEMRMSEDDNASYKDVLEKRKEANRIYNIAISSVPDAPFRDSWDALIMKRMLRLASEEGYDKIAWTNGQMQSDRYNLTKVLGDFYYKLNGDGTYKVSAALNQRRDGYTDYSDLNYDSLTVDGIGEIFGKEIAVKVSEGKGRKGYSHNNESDWVTFSGRDLKMANEGMRYFYDEKLVNWMNKYGKKWGIKVSDLSLPGLENEEGWHSVDVTPEMKESVMHGQLMFSANNSLVGIHNITEENLRKALRAGGLANPSVAVVDISQRGHDQFGAISLILPSYMIDKTSGNNAGTWTDDVWTPIYPRTRTIFTEQGYKNFVDAINKYGSSKSFNKFYAENERDQAYLGKDPDLMWLFLNEVKGIDTTTYEHPGASGAWEDIMDDYKTADKFLKDYQNDEKLRSRTLSLILRYVDSQIEKNHPEIAQITKQEDETFREYIRRKHDAKRPFQSEYMDENGNYTSQTIKDAFNEQKRLYKVNGLVDNLGTKNRALSIINRRGWSDEYWKWHGKRLEELGVKEEIRDGNDRNGNARWKPATVENASKAMNNQALTGANTMGGWGTFISKIARHMTTLDSIRAEKGHLGSDEDARKAKEKFSDMAIMLHDRQPSLDLWNGGAATALANIVKNAGNDIAKFLKTKYHIELDESELAELEQFVSDVKNMKSDYFETKFQRPVDINEFVAAVVPNKTSQDLIDKLESYGLAVRKYNPNKEGDLWRVQKLASREEGIRFSAIEITPEVRAEMEQIQALARLNGTYLKAPNGADTNLNPEQWSMVRTNKFKAWFGDWAGREFLLSDRYVSHLAGNEFEKDETPITEKVAKFYKENYDNRVARDGVGTVVLDARSVKDSIAHGLGRNKAAAFAAVPDVIKSGIEIDRQRNWKGREYDSVTIAAPISINGKGYVAVVILTQSLNSNRFYLHEVALQESLQDEGFKTGTKADLHQGDIANVLRNFLNTSKIVDENGEPRVMYHGGKGKITAFNPARIGSNIDNGTMGAGFYFTSDKQNADNYARNAEGEGPANTTSVYLNIRNPKRVRWNELSGDNKKESEAFTAKAKAQGYDGFITEAVNGATWVVAFEPNQIKSATNNNGEFSRENDDIRFSVADNNSNTSGIIKPIYTGLFVQDKAELEERYPSELPNKYYDHMTSVFRPGEIDAATLGEESDLHIIGRLSTDKVDALLVESEDTNNEHPHITLATADGVKPVASNKEIAENPDKIIPLDDYIRVRKGANMGGSNAVYGLNFSAGRKKVHFTGEDIAGLFGGKPLAENLAELSKAIYEDKFSDYSDEFRQKMTDMVLTEGDPIKAMASFIHSIAAKPDLTQDEQKFVENLYQYVLSLTSIDNFGINDTLWAMDEYITSREQKNNDAAQDSPVQDNANYLDEFIDAAKDAQDDIDTIFEMEREALNEFMSIEKAITKTRNVDRYTAKRMVRLIDSVLAGGLIDNESRSEVKSLLRIVRDAVGMTDIAPEIKKLRRIIVNNTMRRLGSMYNKILEKKAVKVSSKKIVEQGSVDLFGQKMKEAYMEGRDMFIEVDGEYQASDRLKKLIEDNSGYDASGEVDSEMEARFIGYSVAKDYIESLRTGLNNIDLLQQERSDTYESYNNDEISGREKNVRVANIDQRLQEEKESILLPMMDHIDRLSNFFSDRHKKAIEFLEADRRRKYDIFKDADMDLAGVSDSQESITREERSNWHKVTNSGVFRVLTASLGNFDTMLKALGRRSPNGEGFLWNRFMRQWIDSTNEECEGISEANTILNAKASEVFGRKMLWKDLYEVDKKLPKATITYRSISGKEETRELGQASLLYIILASGMADGRMKLEAMGISQDRVNNIKSLIDPRFLELGNWLVNEFLPSRREKYNARHEEIFGASMSQVENYFPIVVNKNARYNEFEATRVGQEQRLGNTITGGIIKRTVNSLPLDIIGANAFSIAYGNVQQMEHWYAFSRFNRDMKDLLSNTSVRNRLRHMESPYGSGETFLDNFEKIVTIAEGEYRPAKVIDSKAVNLGRNFTAACISFRLHTAMKQVLSFPAFISEANTVELAKCLANPAASWNWAMENMPVFKKRWLSRQAGNHILSEADDFKAKALEWAARVGMTPNAFVDAITVSIGARAIYLTKKKRYLDYGFSEEQAHTKALQDAMIGYNETQQSNEGAFLSEIQKQNTWFTTSLTMFRNSSFGYGRMAMNATIDLVRRQQSGYKEEAISAKYNHLVKEGLGSDKALDAAQKEYKRQGFQDAIRIANFTVGVTFAWNLGSYAVYLLFGKDDDKKKEMLRNAFFKGLAGGWAEGLMGGSMVSEAIANWLMGKEIGSLELGTMPVLDALDKLIGNLDKKDWWMAAHDFINMMVQATIGVNPQAIEEVAMSIYDIAGGDLGLFKEIGLGIARLLQVPQSQLDEFYFDEIDMTGDRAIEMTVEEIATIYAERRAARQTGILTPLYPDSQMKTLVDKYRKKYEDEVMNRSMLGVRYDDIRNYSESVVKKADRLLERANGGDESADRKLMELYARDEYGRAVTFLEKDKEISKMFKDAMDTGNIDKMRKLITDANDEKTLLEMDFANESPDYLEKMQKRYFGYTKGFLARMADIESKAPRTPKEMTEEQKAEYDLALNKYVEPGNAYMAEGNKLNKEEQAKYDEALAKVNELTNIEIPDDIRSSREWQVYNILKNSGKVVVKKNGKVEKVEFVPNNVAKAEQDFKKEKDPEMKKIMKGRIEAEKLRFAQIVYDLMQDD